MGSAFIFPLKKKYDNLISIKCPSTLLLFFPLLDDSWLDLPLYMLGLCTWQYQAGSLETKTFRENSAEGKQTGKTEEEMDRH